MINITTPQELTRIYLVTNCYGDPNKVYIGKEKYHKNTSHRKCRHIQTYGEDIIFTYIDEVNSLDHKLWKPLECFWIEYFRQLGFDIQNNNFGGTGSSFLTQETKDKISKAKMGKPNSNTSRNKGRVVSDSENEKRSNKLTGLKRSEETKLKMSISRKEKKCKAKPIIQYNLEGNEIKIWDSITDAANYYNSRSMAQVLHGKTKTSFNSFWKYK